MDKLHHKKEYWKNRKLYRVLQDDTVSSLNLLYFLHKLYYNYNLSIKR